MSDPRWPWPLSERDTERVVRCDAWCREQGFSELIHNAEQCGGHGTSYAVIDGTRTKNPWSFDISNVLHHRMKTEVADGGRCWYLATVTWTPDAGFRVDLEHDSPPPVKPRYPLNPSLRQPEFYAKDLRLYPRTPDRVPGWMKVELAAVGGWDLTADQPTFNDKGPTGVPMTPESAGVPMPPGGEQAQPYDTPIFAEIRDGLPAKQQPGYQPRRGLRGLFGRKDKSADTASTPSPPTPPSGPGTLLDPAPFADLYARWQALAERYPGMITLDDGEGWQRDDSTHVTPALRDAASAFPTVTAAAWTLDWTSSTEGGPPDTALGELGTYQLLHAFNGEAIAVRLNAANNPGEVVRAYEDNLTVVAPDLLSFLTGLTAEVERTAPAAWDAARTDLADEDPDAGDDTDLVAEIATEILEQDLDDFFDALGRH